MKIVFNTLFGIFIAAYAALALLLVGTFVPFAGYQVRIVDTGSMTPTMPVGSAVFIEKAANYTTGDVITFQHPGDKMPTTHRIVGEQVISGVMYYTTKGDANDAPDQRQTAQSDVFGRVWLAVPYLGYVLDFIRKPIGFVLIIGIPLLAIVGDEVMKIFRTVRGTEKQPAEPAV